MRKSHSGGLSLMASITLAGLLAAPAPASGTAVASGRPGPFPAWAWSPSGEDTPAPSPAAPTPSSGPAGTPSIAPPATPTAPAGTGIEREAGVGVGVGQEAGTGIGREASPGSVPTQAETPVLGAVVTPWPVDGSREAAAPVESAPAGVPATPGPRKEGRPPRDRMMDGEAERGRSVERPRRERRRTAAAQTGLTITVPDTASLGTGTTGGTISASLGTVTVEDARNGSLSWTATVSATDFKTGLGSASQTIAKANIAYWSGPVTASSGAGSRTPGQQTAAQRVSLSTPQTAFRGSKAPGIQITSWRPTIVVTIPSSIALGVYTGSIIHSVA
ncbi:hypothetical protein [Sphaerisporangium fuscum]|uniref:hypothetical protein n=1 Tax=Sphaerisporangium fuscum TaxID=2835868 RepID=UPI001BDC746D|nr:hypothetical protein [Sphaerisporangium fuscum]